MSWEQVRFLHRQGFEIGAHTRNHVDQGIVSGDEAREEIEGSRRRLEAELGSEVRYFSYPFGRREQLTDENRHLVRACGFACCLSAYGGLVGRGSQPFDLKRTAVSPWYLSPYQYGFESLFLRP